MNEFWTAVSAILAIAAASGVAYQRGVRAGKAKMRRELLADRDRKLLTEVYAPLFGLFTTRHITTFTGRGAPYLRQRLRNAWRELIRERSPTSAIRAVFDKQDLGTSSEVEYGGSFPLGEITNHLKGKEHLADRELLILIERANRAMYEQSTEPNELTSEDLSLFKHISVRHEQLTRELDQP